MQYHDLELVIGSIEWNGYYFF